MTNKQKRLILILTRKPKWYYKLFVKRFSKGWDVIVANPTQGRLRGNYRYLRGAYGHITAVFDETVTTALGNSEGFDVVHTIKGSPLRLRTFQELWAQLTYDEFKELGHEDEQGLISWMN